jgi:hypothetical protein
MTSGLYILTSLSTFSDSKKEEHLEKPCGFNSLQQAKKRSLDFAVL